MKKRTVILTLVIMFNIVIMLLYYRYIIIEKNNYIKKYNIGNLANVLSKDIDKNEDKEIEIYNIYIPNDDLTYLLVKQVEIESEKLIRDKIFTMFEYIKSNAFNGISSETILNNIYLEGNIAYLNFNRDLGRYISSAESEQIIIYSIINSICEIEDIKKVKFLIEDRNVKELGGYIDISDYFIPDKLLIKGD